jgi:hypothetical protein
MLQLQDMQYAAAAGYAICRQSPSVLHLYAPVSGGNTQLLYMITSPQNQKADFEKKRQRGYNNFAAYQVPVRRDVSWISGIDPVLTGIHIRHCCCGAGL